MILRELVDGSSLLIHNKNIQYKNYFTICSSHKVIAKPPWEKVQFLKYETFLNFNKIITKQKEYAFDRDITFKVFHTYTNTGAYVNFINYKNQNVPLRAIGDGFAPWAILNKAILELHASSVYIDDTLVIILGFHNSGKTTAALNLVKYCNGTQISDDALDILITDEKVKARASFWEEGCKHISIESNKIIIIILDDNSIKYNDGTKRNLKEGMLIAQYVIGLFCNIKIFNLGINLIESLISTASIKIIPALPNANYLTDQINKILKRKGNSC